jgi:hypothetical protein
MTGPNRRKTACRTRSPRPRHNHAAERQIATGDSEIEQSGDLSDHEHDRRDLGGKDRQQDEPGQDEPGAYARPVVPPWAPGRAVGAMAGWPVHQMIDQVDNAKLIGNTASYSQIIVHIGVWEESSTEWPTSSAANPSS